jgi:serine/threonine-protein kinase
VAVKGKHGALLANRYRLLEQLGEGGMGSVWKAEHLALDTHVAIKLIDPDVARFELNLGRFLREAKTLASLRSPHVVQVLDFGSDAEMPYLVMELLHGQTLGRRLLARGRLDVAETGHILSEVCSAITLVHEQGLIHRDLKPDNIFLCEVGERRVAKIVDFGIAKSFRGNIAASMKTRTGHMLGTPSYMSPEQCRGLKDIDHRADLWALGVIAYECLLGRVPFEGEVLGDLLLRICMDPLPVPSQQPGSSVSREFDAWFARAVSRDRAARFQSAEELAMAFFDLPGARERGEALSLRSSPRHAPPTPTSPSSPRQALPSSPSHVAASPRQLPSSPRHVAPSAARPAVPSVLPMDTDSRARADVTGRPLRVDRRPLRLALAAVAVAAVAAGAWALGADRDAGAESPASVEVMGLRPAYEVVPKVLQQRVATGRRLPSSPAAAPAPSPSLEAAPDRAQADTPPALRGTAAPQPPARGAGAAAR